MPRRAKIRHGRWKWVHCSTGRTPNWPPPIVAVMFSKLSTITPEGNFCNQKKWNKEVKIDRMKREGKTMSHSASCLKKRKGVVASSTLAQSDSWDQCNIQHKVHWGWSPVLLTESTPVLVGSHHSVHYCVRLREEEKKRRERRRERKPVSLCGKDSAGKWFCDYLSLPAKQGSSPWPAATSCLLCARVASHQSHTWVCFSGRQTATPGLLLMMRADVRLVSMNIDVEDSLFHRRTEGGKMAAL